MSKNSIVRVSAKAVVKKSELRGAMGELMGEIRPHWQAKNLIARVKRLLEVDPSSACQRIFNAAIHDLREKITVAGVDIAGEVASRYKLPAITQAEDLETYSTARVIELAYRMGLLSRPQWRRVSRCYEIRRDLEHEDDEYEAAPEDCFYIFKTSIEVVLSADPIQLLRVEEVKDLINQPSSAVPSESLLRDYEKAPQARQEEISRFLISNALDKKQSEIVQQNAFSFLGHFASITQDAVKLSLVQFFQDRIGRKGFDERHARVAFAIGVFPYLKQAHREECFNQMLHKMHSVGSTWQSHDKHGELLRSFRELGGLIYCPLKVRRKILYWLVLTYIGTVGGVTRYGNVRQVFYSDTAAPIIVEIIREASETVAEDLRGLANSKTVKMRCSNQHIARRYEALLDLVDTRTS